MMKGNNIMKGKLYKNITLQIDFYNAIAGMDWCWFYNNDPTLLEDYRSFFPCWPV